MVDQNDEVGGDNRLTRLVKRAEKKPDDPPSEVPGGRWKPVDQTGEMGKENELTHLVRWEEMADQP